MKIIVIGGVAGGATAATRMRRLSEENEIILFEKGEYVSFANCGLPYHISGTIEHRDDLLLQTPQSLNQRYRLDVRIRTEVIAIHAEQRSVLVRNLQTGEEYEETYDKLLLSPGAEPVKPPMEGINSNKVFTLRTIPDMDKIIAMANHAAHVMVVGGGFIGLEVAENLIEAGKRVTLVELGNQLMAPVDLDIASFVHAKAIEKGIQLFLNKGVQRLVDHGDAMEVFFSDQTSMLTDAVVMAIGVKPETALARSAGIALGTTGGIAVNEFLQTSNPHIYAVGDAIEIEHSILHQKVLIPLAWPANRQGRLVADNIIEGNKHPYKGSIGSSILKFFELNVACTGLSEKLLKRNGVAYHSTVVTRGHHAGYYPGAKNMILKLLFDDHGKILGAQAVGEMGVDKRLDIIATAIRGNLSVYDLPDIEVTYAPPFNSAKDPVNIAGYTAVNILRGQLKVINHDELWDFVHRSDAQIIDVRTNEEVQLGQIDGAIHIPVDELRNQLTTLSKDRVYVVYCQVGLRGYLAYRMMHNLGFEVYNLNGGYHLWSSVYPQPSISEVIS